MEEEKRAVKREVEEPWKVVTETPLEQYHEMLAKILEISIEAESLQSKSLKALEAIEKDQDEARLLINSIVQDAGKQRGQAEELRRLLRAHRPSALRGPRGQAKAWRAGRTGLPKVAALGPKEAKVRGF